MTSVDGGELCKPKGSERLAQILALAVLFAAPVWICLHMACVWDPDVWWHIRTGQWIVEHHGVPFTDPFSTSTLGKPWFEYSWLFDLLIDKLYEHLGLLGIVLYSGVMILAITIALFHLVKRRMSDFTVAVLLTAVATFCLSNLYSPRSWHFTILFFILELDILLRVRRTGRLRELFWLVPLFALWANLHIQFIDGLLVLALFAADSIFADVLRAKDPANERFDRSQLSWKVSVTVFAACVLATLLNPYGWHVYQVAHDLASQAGVMNRITELKALDFRTGPDFCLLFLVMAATAVLARAKRIPLVEAVLLVLAVFLSFRSQRDIWIAAIVSTAILAAAMPVEEERQSVGFAWTLPLAALVACSVFPLGIRVMHINQKTLSEQLVKALPVRAIEVIQQRGYSGPVFNDFTWGGFLMETLRLPVSIDGRAGLHGDEQLDRSDRTWRGKPDWAANPLLFSAGVVLCPVDEPLTQLLRNDMRFRLVYEDHVAAVFIPRR